MKNNVRLGITLMISATLFFAVMGGSIFEWLGLPQWGQEGAVSLTSPRQSGHSSKAMSKKYLLLVLPSRTRAPIVRH